MFGRRSSITLQKFIKKYDGRRSMKIIRYGSVQSGVAEHKNGRLLMVSDVIKILDDFLDDEARTTEKIEETLKVLEEG